jgi:hypothetical protein
MYRTWGTHGRDQKYIHRLSVEKSEDKQRVLLKIVDVTSEESIKLGIEKVII